MRYIELNLAVYYKAEESRVIKVNDDVTDEQIDEFIKNFDGDLETKGRQLTQELVENIGKEVGFYSESPLKRVSNCEVTGTKEIKDMNMYKLENAYYTFWEDYR